MTDHICGHPNSPCDSECADRASRAMEKAFIVEAEASGTRHKGRKAYLRYKEDWPKHSWYSFRKDRATKFDTQGQARAAINSYAYPSNVKRSTVKIITTWKYTSDEITKILEGERQ